MRARVERVLAYEPGYLCRPSCLVLFVELETVPRAKIRE